MLDLASADSLRRCLRCGTELAPLVLACPACGGLVHRERLEQLAGLATAAAAAGDRATAREHWREALTLVPPSSQQSDLMSERLSALADPQAPPHFGSGGHADTGGDAAPREQRSWWKQGIALTLTLGLLLAGKLKFLLLGLTKASTFVSMFGFFAVYWSIYGWPLAFGLVVSIYIHEMGHVAMLRRLGIHAGAPLFIPGFGAVIMLKQHITDPIVDARIGLAGPMWGLGAAAAAFAVYLVDGAPIWKAIGELTAFINLFNLIPVWQLDGSRGFHALTRGGRWAAVSAIAVMLFVTGLGILWVVGAVGVWRALKSEPGPGHNPTLLTYIGLVVALSMLARHVQ